MTKGMDPELWGPSGWKLLHGLAFMKVSVTKAWYLNLQYILPCAKCQENFKMHTEALGSMHKDVKKWVYKLHERVNNMKGKETPSFADVRDTWKQHEPLRWDDIIPFLDAVVETHPRKGCLAASAQWAFWKPLLEWMGNGDYNGLTPEITQSRAKLRHWWKNYKQGLIKN
jgi:hypothetical protein